MSNTIKLSLISVALLSQLNAEEINLNPIAITSTAIATDELKSTDAVEVYTAQDIEKAHVQNVYEFLNKQTSVITMPSYGNTFTQLIDIHGYGSTNGNQNVVITVDGRRINNIDSAPQLLSSISPSSIAKIEIIKSSGIVRAGDGANAGVINIVTKKNNAKEVSFYMGNYGTFDGTFYLGHSDDKLSISLAGEAQKSDGLRVIDANGNKDENSFSSFTFNIAYKAVKELELRLGASNSNIDVIYGGTLTQAQYQNDPAQQVSPTHQTFHTKHINIGTTYFINNNVSLKVDANHENKESNYVTYNSIYDYTYNSLVSSFDVDYDDFFITIGVDLFNGDRISNATTTTKDNIAAFVMSEFYVDKFTFKAGLRHEKVKYAYDKTTTHLTQDNSLNGTELGANYKLNKQSSIFANYAHAYQAPDIDKFFTFSGAFNAFINPMKTDNYTLGYTNIQATNKFKASLYYIDLKDEIYYYSTSFKNTNINKSHKYGLDFYDKYLINSEFNLVFNYNYVKAIIDEEIETTDNYAGKELPGVSNHNAKVTFSYLPNQYATIALTQVYRSKAYASNDFNNNFSQKQDAFFSTDLAATYAKDNWEVFAKINNLFNQKNGLWIRDNAIYPVNFTTTAMVGFKLKY